MKNLNKKQQLVALRNKEQLFFWTGAEVPFSRVDLTQAMAIGKLWKGLVAKKIDFKLIDLCWRFLKIYI